MKSFLTVLKAAIVSFKSSDIIYAQQLVMVIFLLFKRTERNEDFTVFAHTHTQLKTTKESASATATYLKDKRIKKAPAGNDR